MNTEKIILFIYLTAYIVFVKSCNINVCLIWEVINGNITLKCKVNELKLSVVFYDPTSQEQGHCLSPIPFSKCYPFHNNVISQDKRTNTTILIVNMNFVSTVSGAWKCAHGTNIDEAVVSVTVLRKESNVSAGFKGTCREEFYAYTMIGFTLIIVSGLLFQFCGTLPKRYNMKGCISTKLVLAAIPNIFKCGPLKGLSCIYKCRHLMIFVMIIIVTGTPICAGSITLECSKKEYFIMLGGLAALILLIFVYIFTHAKCGKNKPTTASSQQLLSEGNDPPPNCEEPIRQQLLSAINEEPSGQQSLDVEVHQSTDLEAETKQNNI